MAWENEEHVRVLSILRGGVECHNKYSSISDFKQDLEEGALAHEESKMGWVLYEKLDHPQIITLLNHVASAHCWIYTSYMVQFWGVVKVEGRHHYLSCSHHPFLVYCLTKGECWYRKLSRDHVYVVDVGGGDDEHLGAVGRAYRNKQPESSPDLRLYFTHEFPMRDEAARCGFRSYMAVPLFDSHTYQYYGVLELLHGSYLNWKDPLSILDRALQIAGLRSTHNSISISGSANKMQQPESEITEVLELAMATVPRLHLAQVWVPCQQCVNMDTNLCCMEIASFIDSQSKMVDSLDGSDYAMKGYFEACQFHKLRIDISSCHSNLCDLTISKNPLAHYTQRARMSYCFAISHITKSNKLYVIQFLLQPKCTQDAYGDYSLQLLLRIMEMNLKIFTFVWGKQLLEESLKLNAIECESIDSLTVMKSYKQNFCELNMTTYLKTVDSCCLQPSSVGRDKGWVFRLPTRKGLCTNHVKSNSLLIKGKMEAFMEKIAVKGRKHNKWIVQFWAPKMVENRCYLETSDQPYAVGCLAKGIGLFRKKCMAHYYCMGDEAREEELGPPGRVFRNGHPEITPDLFYYTTKEFPIRNYAMLCCNRGYLALPILDDEDSDKCVGVLEFLGFYYSDLRNSGRALEVAKLCSTHIDFHPRFLANEPVNVCFNSFSNMLIYFYTNSLVKLCFCHNMFYLDQTLSCRKKALTEIRNVLKLITGGDLPQLHMANVWVPNRECVSITNTNMSCMQLALSTNQLWWKRRDKDESRWIHVQARKGIVGMVLASENKSCFCQNLCAFSSVDQPLSHYEMSDRRDVCFAICLQSSHTGYLVYVVEFFLYQGPPTCEYVRSFLSLLLPVMKHQLRSFKMASGKQLGEELVVDVIEFSEANKLGPSESEQAGVFPIKFKSVQYKHQHAQVHQEAEECSAAASDSKRANRGKRKTNLHLSLEILKPHFGKKLQDVAQVLGVGRSTIKRACRDCGIDRWPCNENHKNNPSLFGRESVMDSQQDSRPSTNNLQPLDTSPDRDVTQTNTKGVEKVIIKVKYKDNIKFELSLSLGVAKLMEEVATRLNLEMGTFKLKYLDEDYDEILLIRDDDLQLCPKTQTATGKTCIQLLVR
ncbi:protein NLP5-like isoform X2 [Salvia miltiorrhiza]|uniref:protein NLP5-like isoform X2 n=1 Tax=Salvia miltiorrhiza TaxID=226208 RepID=UPI0025ACDA90|nr:protein NLP5-like isoform X2 [Salvia miltiorrhiza]